MQKSKLNVDCLLGQRRTLVDQPNPVCPELRRLKREQQVAGRTGSAADAEWRKRLESDDGAAESGLGREVNVKTEPRQCSGGRAMIRGLRGAGEPDFLARRKARGRGGSAESSWITNLHRTCS